MIQRSQKIFQDFERSLAFKAIESVALRVLRFLAQNSENETYADVNILIKVSSF